MGIYILKYKPNNKCVLNFDRVKEPLKLENTTRPVTSIFDIDFNTQDMDDLDSQVMPADKTEQDKPAKKFKFKPSTSGSSLMSQDNLKSSEAPTANDNILEINDKDGNKTLLEKSNSQNYPFEKIPQPLSKKVNIKKTKNQLDAKLECVRETQNHINIEPMNILTQPRVTEASSFLAPSSITPVKRSSFSSRRILSATPTPSSITVPKFHNSKTGTATPVASVSMSQLTPRPTSSQGFECLSLSSILEDIGYEESQIRKIVPATPVMPGLQQQGKRKLDNEDQTCLNPESPGILVYFLRK